MKQGQKKPTEGPVKGDERKGSRKRTDSVDLAISRFHSLITKKPLKAGQLLKESEEEISSKDYDVSPMALVIAANATALERFHKKEEKIELYEENIEKRITDPVKLTYAGTLVDLDELLDNYKEEIKRLETARRKRMKYLFTELPNMAMELRTSVRWGASLFVGVSFWGLMYLGLKNAIGDIWAGISGVAIASAAIYITSKKFVGMISNAFIRWDDKRTGKKKKEVQEEYSQKKTAKIKMMARALKSELDTEEKEYELDNEVLEEIGKTMPSPFEKSDAT